MDVQNHLQGLQDRSRTSRSTSGTYRSTSRTTFEVILRGFKGQNGRKTEKQKITKCRLSTPFGACRLCIKNRPVGPLLHFLDVVLYVLELVLKVMAPQRPIDSPRVQCMLDMYTQCNTHNCARKDTQTYTLAHHIHARAH